jgi:hypothetical protein
MIKMMPENLNEAADGGSPPRTGSLALDFRKPCTRCGYCGYIEDADMNLAGVCPECLGAGTLKSQREAAETADGKPDGQAEDTSVEARP